MFTLTIVSKKKVRYCEPEELLLEYNKSLAIGKPTEKLVSLFTRIATRFSTTFFNVNKCDESACINYAVAEAWQKWESYNPERSNNIFSFYTTMIANDMMVHHKLIKRGKKVNISIEALFSNIDK